MWHDPDDRLQKAVDRYDEGDVETARTMLRALDRQGVISPRIDLYLGHCHLDADRPRAALRRYRRCLALSADDASAWVGIALCQDPLQHLILGTVQGRLVVVNPSLVNLGHRNHPDLVGLLILKIP